MIAAPAWTRVDLLAPQPIRPAEQAKQEQIRRILASFLGGGQRIERRRMQRHPFPHLVRVAPVAADGRTPAGPSLVVVGRHLSEGGFDFYCREPLPYRKIAVTLEGRGIEPVVLLMDLAWCRFSGSGWYENGGRFLQVLPAEEVEESVGRKVEECEEDVVR